MRGAVMLLALACRVASAGRVIAIPLCGAPSHTFTMWRVNRELVDRGNDVTVCHGVCWNGVLTMVWTIAVTCKQLRLTNPVPDIAYQTADVAPLSVRAI